VQKALGQRGVVLVLRLDARAEVGAQFGRPDGERGIIAVAAYALNSESGHNRQHIRAHSPNAVEHTPTVSSAVNTVGSRRQAGCCGAAADELWRTFRNAFRRACTRVPGRARTRDGSERLGRTRTTRRDMVSAGNRPGGAGEKLSTIARHTLPLVVICNSMASCSTCSH
jgi:hypothetical protein